MKNPLTRYTPLQIKQFIKHGHVFVNKRKVTFGNYLVKMGDRISIKGLFFNTDSTKDLKKTTSIGHDNISLETKNLAKSLRKNHQETLLLRRLKDKDYLKTLTISENSNALSLSDNSDSQLHLISFIQKLRLKRFSEIFFITYRNLHLIDHSISHPVSPEKSLEAHTHIEKHIKPFFEYLGHNQSIFLL